MEPKPAIRNELVAHTPLLRRFALSLCGTTDHAEDLVQDTLLQALTHLDSFQPGTNLAAWLATILRNRVKGWPLSRFCWRSRCSKARRNAVAVLYLTNALSMSLRKS